MAFFEAVAARDELRLADRLTAATQVVSVVAHARADKAVNTYLLALPGVLEVHDLHIWAMSTTETALTAHLVMETNTCEPRFLGDVGAALHDKFKIEHSTLQVEAPEAPDPCRLAAEGTL